VVKQSALETEMLVNEGAAWRSFLGNPFDFAYPASFSHRISCSRPVRISKTKALTCDALKKLDNNREIKQNTLPSVELEGQ
jgi:hypothetical protein